MNPAFPRRGACVAIAALVLSACAGTGATRDGRGDASRVEPSRSGRVLVDVASGRSPQAVADCVVDGVRRLKIPDDYLARRRLPGGGQAVMLNNPATGRTGLTVDVAARGSGSQVRLYENGMVVSGQWRALVRRCAG
ncbi:hypothetical protein [Crenobacter cavernae]|uniref:Adhesin n=1 Tax=Crenobacter cavernae TaxID=2290923 RepID=A0A345Y461_9NEIS|nr:hypothetical protein [Crenobacter cavernae]AXK38713.1 hypothetical protein DWG20_04315 [Crenobacter cavernae]